MFLSFWNVVKNLGWGREITVCKEQTINNDPDNFDNTAILRVPTLFQTLSQAAGCSSG